MKYAIRKTGLNLLVLTIIIGALIFFVDLRAVGHALRSISLETLVIVFVLASLDRFLMGYKWHRLLVSAGGTIHLRHAVSAYYQSGLGSRLIPVPLGAELLRARLIIAKGIPAAVVFGSIAIEKMLAFLSSSILALAGCLYLLGEFQEDNRSLVLAGLAASVGAGTLLLAAALGRDFHRIGGRFTGRLIPEKLARPLKKFSQAVLVYRENPRAIASNLLLSFLEQIVQFAKFFVIGRSLGIALPALPFFALLSLTVFSRRLGGYLEGWSLGEFGAFVILALFGIDRDIAAALIFLNFAVTFSAALPGAYLLYRSRFGLKTELLNTNGSVRDL